MDKKIIIPSLMSDTFFHLRHGKNSSGRHVTFSDDAWAEYQKGMGFHNNCLYDQAINSYTKAINMGCHHPETYGLRGNAYNSLGKYQSAIVDYTKAIELLHDGNNYDELPDETFWIACRGMTYPKIGDYKHALEDLNYYYNNCGKIGFSNAEQYYVRGIVYWNLGDKEKAKEDFKQAVKLDPKSEKYKDALKGNVPEQAAQQAQETQAESPA